MVRQPALTQYETGRWCRGNVINQVNFKPTCHIYHPTLTPKSPARKVELYIISGHLYNSSNANYLDPDSFTMKSKNRSLFHFVKFLRSFSRFECCIYFGKAKTRGGRNQIVKISLPKLTTIFDSGVIPTQQSLKSAVSPPNLIHHKKKDGDCTFYHNTLRTKLSSPDIKTDMV